MHAVLGAWADDPCPPTQGQGIHEPEIQSGKCDGQGSIGPRKAENELVGKIPATVSALRSHALLRDASPLQQYNGCSPDNNEPRVGALAIFADAQPSPDSCSKEKQLPYNLLVLPRCRCRGAAGTQVGGLERRLAKDQIQQRGVVGLDEEEEYFLKRNVKQRGADDDMARVTPYIGADEIGVPWYCRGDSDLPLLLFKGPRGRGVSTYSHQEDDLEGIEFGEKWPVQQSKQHGRRYGVFDMAGRGRSVCGSSRMVKYDLHVHNCIVKAHSDGGGGLI